MKSIVLSVISIKSAKILFNPTLGLSLIYNKCYRYNEKMFKKEESVEILKILSWINNMNK